MEAMISFVDAYRDDYGVEPICRVIEIAPSTYHAQVGRRAKPETAPARVKRDTMLSVEIKRVFNENFQVYGVRKVWRQLLREGHDVARCTVARLMKKMALQGVIRGRRVRTTVSDKATPCPLDHVNRRFRAPRPNVLWVADFTYVATWIGFVYVAFVIDAYARRIVGWRVSRSAHAGFVLDASRLLRSPGGTCSTRRLTQTNQPPRNSGQFRALHGGRRKSGRSSTLTIDRTSGCVRPDQRGPTVSSRPARTAPLHRTTAP